MFCPFFLLTAACFKERGSMKKKMLFVVMVFVVIALMLMVWYILFAYFGKGPLFPFVQYQEIDAGEGEPAMIAEDQLMVMADTEKMALKIADQYGIELTSFENGIAVYHTEEDPFEVIARGQANGYAQLSINFVRTMDEEKSVPVEQLDFKEFE